MPLSRVYLINIFIFKLKKETCLQAHLWAETQARDFRPQNHSVTENYNSITTAAVQ